MFSSLSLSLLTRRSWLKFAIAVAVALMASLLPFVSHAEFQSQKKQSKKDERQVQTVPGEILVRFRSGSGVSKGATPEQLILSERRGPVAVTVERLGGPEIVQGLRIVRVRPEETGRALETLRARADVIYAEPNYIRKAFKLPNDPRFAEMWGLKNTGQPSTSGGNPGSPGNDIRAEQGWDITTGSSSVVVGVIDSGIDVNHEDLRDNIWRNPAEIAANGVDDDANGFVDDVNGWDFAHNDNSVFDYSEPTYPPSGNYSGDEDDHGTHVAGTIGATGNNGIGIAGVNWQVSLVSLKFLTGTGDGTSADLLKAFSYAKMMRDLWASSGGTKGANIRVLNNSYGGGGHSQAELEAIRALGDAGILFVVSAGNESLLNDKFPVYPANYISTNLISVAASNGGGTRASFSNYGPGTVNLTAPGEHILSTTPRNTYTFFDGTSMAAPHVSGSAALVCAAFPNASLDKLRSAVLYSGYAAAWQYQYIYPVSTGRSVAAYGALSAMTSGDTVAPGPVQNINLYHSSFPEYRFTAAAPGDDGTVGKIASYEVRFADTDLSNPAAFDLATPLPGPIPDVAGSVSHFDVRLPWRHPTGFIGIRAVDEVGNAGPITTIPISVSPGVGDPYSYTVGAPSNLSSGGTALGLITDDEYKHFTLPFSFKFYEGEWSNIWVSSNGALYFGFPPDTDFDSSVRLLNGFRLIAGAWDDLRTDRRAGDDVYVVKPDDSRIIFRWHAVTFDTPLSPTATRGEHPVNFEIELQINGTVIIRYGDGNQKLAPIVGLGGFWPEPYVVESHSSEKVLKDLTNAGTITFTHRNPPPPPTSNLSVTMAAAPNPVNAGGQITYSLSVFNHGPSDAVNTVLVDQLPAGVTLVSCTTSHGSCGGATPGSTGNVSVNLGQLNLNTTANITIIAQVTAASGATLNNTATVSSSRFDNDTSNNSTSSSVQVVAPATFDNVAAVTSAGFINFALKQDGTLWGWGKNDYGGIGDGTLFSENTRPVPVNISSVKAISTGGNHALALKTDGTVWAWGFNDRGGAGTVNPIVAIPVMVQGISDVVAVSAGLFHSMAIRSDGTLWVWGGNNSGQLGLGSTDFDVHPVPVQVPGFTSVVAIAAGSASSVAVLSDGTVWTWGDNVNGQLGKSGPATNTPARVEAVSNVKSVAAGFHHVLALKNDGTVVGWGMNAFGQTGSSDLVNVNPTPTHVNNLSGVADIACGWGFSLALKGDGTVWGWGLNNNGELGNGAPSGNPQLTPTMVSGITTATDVAAGNSHGLALLSDGTIRSWGNNTYGQLGDGTKINRSSPVEVTGVLVVAQPTFLPGSHVGNPPIVVQVKTTTAGAVIRYTTNGQDPTENDAIIESGSSITITQNLTLKARAFKPGWQPSLISVASYQILVPPPPASMEFSSASYTVSENNGSAFITLTRSGDTAGAASVEYITADTAALTECNVINGVASSRCDYALTVGRIQFGGGETTKQLVIPLVNDSYSEGNETFTITIRNPWLGSLGGRSTAQVTIQDDDSANGANPLDNVDFFIDQHYIDFLGRNAEPAGLQGWRNVLNNCGVTVAEPCDRIEVSAGFFRSPEFQARGYFVYRFYSAVGRIPLYPEFTTDFAKVSGFLSDMQLEAAKENFIAEFMARDEFQTKYSSTFNNPTAYVDALLQTVGMPNHPSRQTLINQLEINNPYMRGKVLRALVESQQVYDKYYNEAFVIMQYFGYLRRTADASYLDWIKTMNETNGDYRIMINGFLNSAEYRRRFGP